MDHQLERMSEDMREKLDEAIRYQSPKEWKINLTEEYIDQAPTGGSLSSDPGKPRYLFATYTPWGVACIEAAFRNRMLDAPAWDSKDRIHRDILTNPHLHLNIKERLLRAFEEEDWAGWYDSHFCVRIRKLPPGEPQGRVELRSAIEKNPYLTAASRENLLGNLSRW